MQHAEGLRVAEPAGPRSAAGTARGQSQVAVGGGANKYSGRSWAVMVSEPARERAIARVMAAVQVVEPLSKGKEEWKDLKNELVDAAALLSDPHEPLPLFKLEIFSDSICPYLSSMKSRISVSSERFPQLRGVLNALDLQGSHYKHPAAVLLDIEDIVCAIDREPAWFRSDLSTKLRHAVSQQWGPILAPIRSDLQSIAVKLIFVSLIEIARPLVLAWPLMSVIQQALKLVQQMEDMKSGHGRQVDKFSAIMQMAKPLLLLFIVYQLTSVLSLLAGSGFLFGIIGVLLLVFQSSNALLKPHVPLIAEHLTPLVSFIDTLHEMESRLVGSQHATSSVHAMPPPPPHTRPLTQRELNAQAARASCGTSPTAPQSNYDSSSSGSWRVSGAGPILTDDAKELVNATSSVYATYAPLVSGMISTLVSAVAAQDGAPRPPAAERADRTLPHPQVAELTEDECFDSSPSAPPMPDDEYVELTPGVAEIASEYKADGGLRRRKPPRGDK